MSALKWLPVVLLAGCGTTVAVRAPVCEPPPLPPAAIAPCPMPTPIADGRMETLYLQSLTDTALWGECIRKFNNLRAMVEYRDAKIRECQGAATAPDKPWWRFGQ